MGTDQFQKQTLSEAHSMAPIEVPEDVAADPNWFDPKMKLHGSRVLVKVVFLGAENPDATSKIILPGVAANSRDTRAGCILAVGTGPVDKDGGVLPLPLNPGDYVLFSANTGMSVSHLSIRDSKVFIVGYHEILAQLPTDDARRMCGVHKETADVFAQAGKSASHLSGVPVGRGGSSDGFGGIFDSDT